MKQIIAAFFQFSRVERLGITLMGLLFMLLIIIRCTLVLWVHPAGDDAAQNARLATAYKTWKAQEDALRTASTGGYATQVSGAGELFFFDPNTLDSTGFIRLGMPVKAVKGLLNWRRHHKHFYKPEDLKPLYNLPEETYTRLAPYIRIASTDDNMRPSFSSALGYAPIPAIIDLNTADSALLDRGINGIGATLAHKIVARRAALGGFLKLEQLLEIYKFPDTTFQRLRERLRIDPMSVRRMKLNTVTLEQLSVHPYVGEKMAKNILLLREGIGRFAHIEDLRQVPLMNEEIYRKIAPYFVID